MAGAAGDSASAGAAGAAGDAAGGAAGEAGTGGVSAGGQAGDAGAAGEAGSGQAGAGGDAGAGGAPAVCGDKIVQPGEQCDDGNDKNDDGCGNNCKVQCPKLNGVALNTENFHCYWYRGTQNFSDNSWNGMRKKCEGDGGHLVTITTPAENEWVHNFHQGEVFIGSWDHKDPKSSENGKYDWVNGEPYAYTNWGGGEPNKSPSKCFGLIGEDCYEHCTTQRSDGFWNDRRCDQDNDTVCEWEPPGLAP
jgi:cysteine-rich repeat protein